ncbi:carbohydrate ABC transporter permease [Paenibacillus sp. HB172176]|uniref:carbohydrate ABC transporter permease n=1 Tax=Paenibacillus sp. HB172176 TaxID=2493690 RepID=UPI00143C7C7F|nr:carbohydrate ABC transporter permease [Paenibacillus sp. HB172176]
MKARATWFDGCIILMLIILNLLVIVPFFYVIVVSFSPASESLGGQFYLWPKEWSFDAYSYLLGAKDFIRSFKNSFIITALGTMINLVISISLAYALSKRYLPGRRFIQLMVLFTLMFQGGLIPSYLIIKNLHLVNTYWAIVLPAATNAFTVFVMRAFFQSLPESIDEAARIDGAGEYRILLQIVIPLSMPIIATFSLFFVVQYWNDYFASVIYLNDTHLWPLQPLLRQMIASSSQIPSDANVDPGDLAQFGPNLKNAAILLAMIPIIVIYPFLQKYFAKGALLGSVKG